MRSLQDILISAKRIFPRGWSPLLIVASNVIPPLRNYPVQLKDGSQLTVDLRQRMSHGLFFSKGQPHELGTEKAMQKLLVAGNTFVDVGANVGYYTAIASQIVGRTGRVVAIEPQPSTIRTLRINAQAQQANVSVVEKAVSDTPGTARFFVRSAGDTSSLGTENASAEISVQTDTLDNVLSAESNVSFIKIDVEGYELSVLRGCTKTLRDRRPFVCYELLESMVIEGKIDPEDYARFFDSHSYKCFWVDHTDSARLTSDRVSNYVLAVPIERIDAIKSYL
jgi:FkbM family methyltransferase